MAVQKEDVQGLAFSGYARWPASVFRVLRIRDPRKAKRWLAAELDNLTYGAADRRHAAQAAHCRNLAFTCEGLVRLGLPEEATQAFETPFREGMATPKRSLFLGDLPGGRSDPAAWRWGADAARPVHLMQLLYARDAAAAAALCAAEQKLTQGFLEDVVPPVAVHLTPDGKEHFGFADGLSQPAYEAVQSPAEAGYAARKLATGELLLGHADGLGNISPGPLIDPAVRGANLLAETPDGLGDFGLNGAYLVCRQMRQDVPGFHAMLDRLAASATLQTRLPTHSPAERAAWAGSRIIGRWPSGCPVTASPDRDDPQFAGRNAFMFEEADPKGLRCPFGAHIRRANPRDSLFEPWRETSVREAEKGLPDNDRRRILRRGRAFGPPFQDTPDAERGLVFLALGGSIERQFEFVQHSWVLNPNFAGLADETDPLAGAGPTALSLPGEPVAQRLTGISPHIWTEAGAYFFLPSRRALGFLAA
jgi:Dyp-type peroxidase family